jgi:hypothetical protein
MKICIQQGYEGRERTAVIRYALQEGIQIHVTPEPSCDSIPVGTVEFCQQIFGKHRVDFYPDIFPLGRSVFYADDRRSILTAEFLALRTGSGVFVKRAGVWKDENHPARVFRQEKITTPPPFWYSTPVVFVEEWRLYVLNGQILAAAWYAGTDEDAELQDFHLGRIGRGFPRNFSGAVDIGLTDKGNFLLVEAQPPFACGWYGESEDFALYGRWIVEGWQNAEWWKDDPRVV